MKTILPFPKDPGNYRLSTIVETEVSMYSFDIEVDADFQWNPGKWRPRGMGINKKVNLLPYIPSSRMSEAIELAQVLDRPILLQGEPGSGKTKLAEAVAFDWYGERYLSKYFEWHVKSNSKAADGLYTFDHVARLRDAHLIAKTDHHATSIDDLSNYLQLGPLGRALLASTPEEPAILLIDEIDKADIDFPNDLLLEIDEKRARIQEPGIFDISLEAKQSPLIFITSNQEKDLSPAFIRRCLYLYFKFPNEKLLKKIIKARHPELSDPDQLISNNVIKRFNKLRTDMENNPNISRLISTSEFLDWTQALIHHFSISEPEDTIELIEKLPYSTTLLKSTDELKMENLFFSNLED